MPRQKKGLTPSEIIGLLKNPRFCANARTIYEKARLLHQAAPTQKEWDSRFPKFEAQVIFPFEGKWGATLPPRELVDPDPRRKPVYAILTGRFGLIPVFPWTTIQEIEKRARQVRRSIGKKHMDLLEESSGLIASWLETHNNRGSWVGPSRSSRTTVSPGPKLPRGEIASAVWGRKTGLTRPTKEEAIDGISVEQEEDLFQHYLKEGLSRKEVDRRVYRRLRGTETPAAAQVRMALKRLGQQQRQFRKDLQNPRKADPLGHSLTLLLQEASADSSNLISIKKKAAVLRALLIPAKPSR